MKRKKKQRAKRKRNRRRGLNFECLEARRLLTVFQPSPADGTQGIQAAIDSAISGKDSILLEPATYVGEPILVKGKDLLIAGIPGQTVLDFQRSGTGLTAENAQIHLYGVTLINGANTVGAPRNLGGNFSFRNSYAILDRVTSTQGCSSVGGAGGALHNTTAYVLNSVFSENSQLHDDCPASFAGNGSALLPVDGTELVVSNSSFIDNVAWASAAIYASGITAGGTTIARPASSIQVFHSQFTGSRSDAVSDISLDSSSQVDIRNNLFYKGSRGVFANPAIALTGGETNHTANFWNNTFVDYDAGISIGGGSSADVRNNVFFGMRTAISSTAEDTRSAFNTFFNNQANHTGGIQFGEGDVVEDPVFENPDQRDFRVAHFATKGDPSLQFRNRDGSINTRGMQGGPIDAKIRPSRVVTSLERLSVVSFVLSQLSGEAREPATSLPSVNGLDFNEVVSIGADNLADEGGTYITGRPVAGVDNFPLHVYAASEPGDVFQLRDYAEARLDYSALGIIEEQLPEAARAFSRINTGAFDDVNLDFPQVSTVGGDDAFLRTTAFDTSFGVSTRLAGANDAFSKSEDFAWLEEIFIRINADRSITAIALFNSIQTTGAVSWTIKAGRPTIVEIETVYFSRVELSGSGMYGPLAFSTMHWRSHSDFPDGGAAFDTQYVTATDASGDRVIHEIANPSVDGQIDVFDLGVDMTESVTDFAMLQIDRNREHFQQFDFARYDLRSSMVTKIVDSSIDLTVIWAIAHTKDEFADNGGLLVVPKYGLAPTTKYSDAVRIKTESRVGRVESEVNQLPVIEAVSDQRINRQDSGVIAGFFVSDDFTEADAIEFSFRSSHSPVIDAFDIQATVEEGQVVLTIPPQSAGVGKTTIEVLATDSLGSTATRSFEVSVYELAWKNPTNPLDVNADNIVTPLDVLLGINWLNSTIEPQLPPVPSSSQIPPYLDVNGDGLVTPLDLLLVINYLNQGAGAGEAEGFGWSSPGPTVTDAAALLHESRACVGYQDDDFARSDGEPGLQFTSLHRLSSRDQQPSLAPALVDRVIAAANSSDSRSGRQGAADELPFSVRSGSIGEEDSVGALTEMAWKAWSVE